jgi:hypothetical protein
MIGRPERIRSTRTFAARLVAAGAVALLLLGAAPSAEAGGKRGRNRTPALAVWDVQADDEHRAVAAHWYERVAAAVAALPDLVPDAERDFAPRVAPAEGLTVAARVGQRWLEAGWVALRGREGAAALSFAQEALEQVEPFPAARLPEGLLRDLQLLEARAQLLLGNAASARASIRAATLLDPDWEPRPGWESPDFVRLWSETADERASAPPATLVVRSSEAMTRVLVYGVERGTVTGAEGATLTLPPGIYEITGRKAGFADSTERVHLKPHDSQELDLTVRVENSAAFQERLVAALGDPGSQQGSPVWEGLRLANIAVEARGVLVGRFVAAGEPGLGGARLTGDALQVALFLPGRRGWAFWRQIPISGDRFRDEAAVDRLAEDLLVTLDRSLHPVVVAER